MKRILLFSLAIVFVIVTLTACGNNTNTEESSTSLASNMSSTASESESITSDDSSLFNSEATENLLALTQIADNIKIPNSDGYDLECQLQISSFYKLTDPNLQAYWKQIGGYDYFPMQSGLNKLENGGSGYVYPQYGYIFFSVIKIKNTTPNFSITSSNPVTFSVGYKYRRSGSGAFQSQGAPRAPKNFALSNINNQSILSNGGFMVKMTSNKTESIPLAFIISRDAPTPNNPASIESYIEGITFEFHGFEFSVQ